MEELTRLSGPPEKEKRADRPSVVALALTTVVFNPARTASDRMPPTCARNRITKRVLHEAHRRSKADEAVAMLHRYPCCVCVLQGWNQVCGHL